MTYRLIAAFLLGVALTAIISYLYARHNGSESRSFWGTMFGNRSLLSVIVGGFFQDKNNAASVIAILLVTALCYIVAFQQKYEYANGLLNIVFVVIGYYFGSKRVKDEENGQGSASDKSGTTQGKA